MRTLTTTLALAALTLGTMAWSSRNSPQPASLPSVDDAIVNQKLDAQIQLTLSKLRKRALVASGSAARFP
jgi:hypothetical protein